jgi:hypothetical protein
VLKFYILIAACVTTLTVGAANADTLESFNISGTFGEELACVNGGCSAIPFSGLGMTGTLVVCETCSPGNGEWTQSSKTLVVPGLSPYFATSPASLGDAGLGVRDDAVNSQADPFQFFIPTPLNNDAILTGYDGGPIGGTHDYSSSGTWAYTPWTVTCAGPSGPTSCAVVLTDLVGTISPAVSGAPLPAGLPLFATGLGVIGLLARRRKQKAAAALAAA